MGGGQEVNVRTGGQRPMSLRAQQAGYNLYMWACRGRADSSIREEGVGGVDEGVGGGADWGLANRVPSWAGVNPFLGLHLRAGRRHVGVVARLGGNSSCIRFDPFQKPLRMPHLKRHLHKVI
eukprot:EG_transcript_36411